MPRVRSLVTLAVSQSAAWLCCMNVLQGSERAAGQITGTDADGQEHHGRMGMTQWEAQCRPAAL